MPRRDMAVDTCRDYIVRLIDSPAFFPGTELSYPLGCGRRGQSTTDVADLRAPAEKHSG